MAYHVEGRDLVIDGFEKGIAETPYDGTADARNVNLISIPNEASVSFGLTANSFPTYTAASISVATATNLITYTPTANNALYNGASFTVASSANGLTAGTKYWVGNLSGSTFKAYKDFSAALGLSTTTGTFETITSDGTNTFTTIRPTLAKHQAYDPSSLYANYYFLDDSSRVWGYFFTNSKWVYLGNANNGSNGNGLACYQGWILAFDDYSVWSLPTDFMTITWQNTAGTVILNAYPVGSNPNHTAIVGYDDTVYYCDSQFIGSILAYSDYARGLVTAGDAGADTITLSYRYGAAPAVNSTIVFYGGSLPAGISLDTVYYIVGAPTSVTALGGKFQISATLGGATLNITGDGTGNYRNFDPKVIGSRLWTTQALALPSFEVAQCLAVLGSDLLIGCITNRIYPWDKLSISVRSPILISENNVQRLITVNTNTYIFAGNRGRIWKTNGSQASIYKKIPDYIFGAIEPYITWQGVGYNRNQIYFSFSATNNAGTALTTAGGLWALDVDKDVLRMPNKFSYNTYAGYAGCFIPTQETTTTGNGFGFQVGWTDGAGAYGVDITSSTPYSNYETYIETEIIPVGTLWTRRTWEQLEYLLGAPMVSGEGVKIEYRTNLTASWASAGAFQSSSDNTSTVAGTISDVLIPTFENVQWIQLRVSTKSTASTPSYTRLREVRLR